MEQNNNVFTKEMLEARNIRQVREIAKMIGIRPKNTPKETLINEVLEKQEELIGRNGGKINQPIAKMPEVIKRGRPKKDDKFFVAENDFPSESFSDEKKISLPVDKGDKKEERREYLNPDGSPAIIDIREGVLEIMPDGYGFIRANNFEAGLGDGYLSAIKIRKAGLRKGDWVRAECRKESETKPAPVVNILSVNGMSPEKAFGRPNFDSLTPVYPDTRYKLESPGTKNEFAIRAIDLVSPIGRGQRAMIVSPPKAGKTTLLKKIAASISKNYPTAYLMVLLIDERPEEVTDMQRSINGEVVYSTFDEMPEHHTKAAELVLERAKRIVELGGDVVILMDSLTRLARAYNLVVAPSGKTLSGGIDPTALHNPKRFFGAARNIENGGSLTIIATALVDTGSRMDDVIYEEFKGTGNMEIHLDRKLSEKRIFPAIDLAKSSTRREELLLTRKELEGIWSIRKMLSVGDTAEATENLISMMVKTQNNAEFIEQISLQVDKLQKEGFLRGNL